jgi:succinate dehydrogenase / fumarate reductase cytochrome b subunit
MAWLKRTFDSSVGGKFFVALTGLALVGFLVAHLAGNLLVYAGPDALNAYAKGLRDLGPLLWVARIGLLFVAVTHVYLAIRLNLRSREARPLPYAKKNYRAATPASRSMLPTGLFLLFYIFYHLADYTWRLTNPAYKELAEGDVYQMVVIGFQNPFSSLVYIVAMVVLGLHLNHGISSLFQTLGLNHQKYNSIFRKMGPVLGTALALGFVSIPIAVLAGFVK